MRNSSNKNIDQNLGPYRYPPFKNSQERVRLHYGHGSWYEIRLQTHHESKVGSILDFRENISKKI